MYYRYLQNQSFFRSNRSYCKTHQNTVLYVYKGNKMANLIIFGVPNGEQASKCDENTKKFLESFYITRTGTHKKMYTRRGNETHYVLLVYADSGTKFLDAGGRGNSYFGMDFILKNQYATNPNKIFDLLQATYNQYVKNKIIKEYPNGNKQWLYNNININNDKITKDVIDGINELIRTRPEFNLSGEIRSMNPIQSQNERH